MSWYEAKLKDAGRNLPEKPEFDEGELEKMATEWALQIRRALPRGFENQDDLLVRALEILHPRLPQRLHAAWAEEEDDAPEEGDE